MTKRQITAALPFNQGRCAWCDRELRRLARSIGNPMDPDRPPDPNADAIAAGKVVKEHTHKPRMVGRRGVPVSLGWRKQVRA